MYAEFPFSYPSSPSSSSSSSSYFSSASFSFFNRSLMYADQLKESRSCMLFTPKSMSVIESLGINLNPVNTPRSIWSPNSQDNLKSLLDPFSYTKSKTNNIYLSSKIASLSNFSYTPSFRPPTPPLSIPSSSQTFDYTFASELVPLTLLLNSGNASSPYPHFTIREPPENSRFFVIKSRSEFDIEASFLHEIWCSTDFGNKRLQSAYTNATGGGGKVYLFFSVNGLGKFCGIAEMSTAVDFNNSTDIWQEESKYKGSFEINWLTKASLLNKKLFKLKNPLNSNKPVCVSRDTQELSWEIGLKMIEIYNSHHE